MAWEIIALIIVAILVVLFFLLVRRVIILVINSIIGIFALMGFNILFNAGIQINFWSVIITAIGGIIGFIIVLIFHYAGWAF
ncbi:MAG TPA: pro-sigmaK processing inhibitor BofA family protein [Candidatus Nanoarchaeia archaeon]|nr:pro-sigmaK processing inhibitor BofA family protein [Candidatus Nanoarchaeia archaeon]